MHDTCHRGHRRGLIPDEAGERLALARWRGRRDGRPALGVAFALLGSCLAVLAQSAAAPQQGGSESQLLRFLDGSTLRGSLQSIDTAKGLRWEHPDARQPINFLSTNLDRVWFDSAKPAESRVPANCRVQFQNGDEIYGGLVALNKEQVEMETWFGGRLQAPAAAIDSIAFTTNQSFMVFEGPSGVEGWRLGSGTRGFRYDNGTFWATNSGSLGRDFNLTGSATLEFDLNWTGPFGLILSLYTDRIERFDYNSSAYTFFLNPATVSLQRIQTNGPVDLGGTPVPGLARKKKARFEIRVNKEKAILTLLIDGERVHQWKDDDGFRAQGTGILFFSQTEGPLRISNLRISEWDDRLRRGEARKEDEIFLINRDIVPGRIREIKDGKVLMTAAGKQLEVPLPRVTGIAFASDGRTRTASGPWQVRGLLASGGSIHFNLETWNPDAVSGRSANFGRIALRPQFLRQIEFNLARNRSANALPTHDEDDDW